MLARPSTRVVRLCIRFLLEAKSYRHCQRLQNQPQEHRDLSRLRLSRRTLFSGGQKDKNQKGTSGHTKEGEKKKKNSIPIFASKTQFCKSMIGLGGNADGAPLSTTTNARSFFFRSHPKKNKQRKRAVKQAKR